MKISGRRSVCIQAISVALRFREVPRANLSLFSMESQIGHQGQSVLPDELVGDWCRRVRS